MIVFNQNGIVDSHKYYNIEQKNRIFEVFTIDRRRLKRNLCINKK